MYSTDKRTQEEESLPNWQIIRNPVPRQWSGNAFTCGLKIEESIVEESRGRNNSAASQKRRFTLAEFLDLLWSTSSSSSFCYPSITSSFLFPSPTSSTALLLRTGRVFEPRTWFVHLFFIIDQCQNS